MKNIGEITERALTEDFNNPVIQLRNLIEKDRSQILWLAENRPELDLRPKYEHLERLDSICRMLESWPPIEPWKEIWKRLGEARREFPNADVGTVFFPLKSRLPESYFDTKRVFIDLTGYNLPHPAFYEIGGRFAKTFLTSEYFGHE